MNIFDLITQEELDDAPDDPQLAFTQLVGHAQRRLSEYTKALGDDHDSWAALEEARHGFMNVIVGLAKSYEIQPFATLEVPKYDKFTHDEYRQFKADLDHFMTQLIVSNTIKGKRDSVQLAPEVKSKIRSYIHGLKTAIDNGEFSDSKRARLHKILVDFESELEKRRLSLMAVTKFAFVILAIPGNVWASYELVTKLTNNVLQSVGEAKAVEDESRLIPETEPPPKLSPPRKDYDAPLPAPNKVTKDSATDLDDEIPF